MHWEWLVPVFFLIVWIVSSLIQGAERERSRSAPCIKLLTIQTMRKKTGTSHSQCMVISASLAVYARQKIMHAATGACHAFAAQRGLLHQMA